MAWKRFPHYWPLRGIHRSRVDYRPVISCFGFFHDDVIKLKHFPRYWPFVWGIHRSSVNSPHKGQWRGALMFTLICARINGWVNNRKAGDLRRYRAHYEVTIMSCWHACLSFWTNVESPMIRYLTFVTSLWCVKATFKYKSACLSMLLQYLMITDAPICFCWSDARYSAH